jgi:predicted RNA-binding protein YlqC (UPF0109 family)
VKELIEYISKSLVDDPEAVRVDPQVMSSRVIIRLRVAPRDMGRVIGKRGRVANSMRALLRVVGSRQGKSYVLEID